ncbi:hypothetical protein V6N13_020196 [Hibiscus sabdariffa]
MDFHCLTRKELQFLCKKNKIPANITNVAMADALKALELVEGLEEFQNQSQSPEKTVNKEILGTVTRTSTRRKPSKDEHQSTQSTIRTRKSARKTTGVEENKNLNVPEIEVKDLRKSDVTETPLPSGRRRPGVGSTRSKVNDLKEGSLQRVYGTRQSVRLLEKSMAGLCIKESEKKPLKVDEMVEGEDGSNTCQSGATLELPLARNLSASLEDERELEADVEENSKCVNVESDETDEKLIPEDDSYNGESNEMTDEPEVEDKVADNPDGIIDPKVSAGSDGNAVSEDSNLNEELVADEGGDVAVSNDAYDIKNLNEKLEADETNHVADETNNENEESVFDKTKSIEAPVANAEDVPDVTILPKAEEHAIGEVSQNVPVLPADGHTMDSWVEKENEKSNGDDAFLGNLDINDDTASDCISLAEEHTDAQSVPNLPAEGQIDSSAEKENEESNGDDAFLGNSDIDDDTASDCNSLAEEHADARSAPNLPAEGQMDSSAKKENEQSDDDSDIDDDTGSDSKLLADELQEEVSCEQKGGSIPTGTYSSEGPRNMVSEESESSSDDDDSTGNEESDDDDTGSGSKSLAEDPMTNMVDANVTEAETTPVSSFHNAPQSVADSEKVVNYGGSEALIDVCVKPAEEFAEMAPVSKSETITTTMPPSSPLKAQFLLPSESSDKIQTTLANVTQVSDNVDKENTVEKELELQKLEGLSLRQLRKLNKMFKKLDITETNKNKEDNKQPSGKSRTALQMLPQN